MLRLAKLAALVSAVVLLNAVTTLLFVQAKVPAVAQVPAPCVDGDVNGDSGLDISDPVYLLQHLFEGGPAPVACAQAPTAMELESVLAKFFPRHSDRFYQEAANAPTALGGVSPVLTVPAGKQLVITAIELHQLSSSAASSPGEVLRPKHQTSQANALGAQLLVNGERVPGFALYAGIVYYQINGGGSGGMAPASSPIAGSVALLLQPGDELAIEYSGDSSGVALYGYWADAP